jgi:predicted amidohydrolase
VDDPRALSVLLAQLRPVDGDVAANAQRLVQTLEAHPRADLAVFPELFLTGYTSAAAQAATASDQVPAICRAAAQAGTAVIVGLSEERPEGVYDSALCVDRDGSVAGIHRKACLFGDERATFVPGAQWTVVELAGLRVAPLICFEVEFPEPARAVARAGAELLVTIAANMRPYGPDHELASRARALDNRLPHVYVNRVGHEEALTFVGGSQVIGATGQVGVRAGPDEGVLSAEVVVGGSAGVAVDYLAQLPGELPVAG